MKKIFFIWVLLFAFVSCQYAPYAHFYITKKPTKKEVIGVYLFKFQTMDEKIDDEKVKKKNARIVIHSNGTYIVHKIPYFKELDFLNYEFKKSASFSGTWEIKTIGSVSNGGDDSEKYWGLVLESAPKELKYAILLENPKLDGILFSYGDPDQGDVILLEKVE